MNFIEKILNIINFEFLGAVGFGALLATLLQNWLQDRREKKLEKKEAIALVSELLSEWVKSSYTKNHSDESRWKLQSLYWKTILKLDKKILDILIPRLANKKNAKTTNEIVVECRKILLDLKKKDVKATDLNVWLPLNKK